MRINDIYNTYFTSLVSFSARPTTGLLLPFFVAHAEAKLQYAQSGRRSQAYDACCAGNQQ